MKHQNPNIVEQYAKRSKYRGIWQKIVRILACIVVFCTTYALILPVITMEQKYFCGLEAHIHEEACYTYDLPADTCSAELLGVHTHTGGCYDEAGTLICGHSDKVIHIHDGLCYDSNGDLWCLLETMEEHTHTDACYTLPAATLICTTPEGEAHTHEESCYQQSSELALTCGITQRIPHTHLETCAEGCTMTVQLAHQHTDACIPSLEKTIRCGLEEHTHTNVCAIDPNATEPSSEEETEAPTEAEAFQEMQPIMMMMSPGPATVAENGKTYTHTMTVADPTNLVLGQSYVIYYKVSENQYAILSSSNSTSNNPYATQSSGAGANPTTIGAQWGLDTNDISSITWKLEAGEDANTYRLAAKGYDHPNYEGPEYLCIYNNNVQTWYHAGQVDFQFTNVDGATVKLHSADTNQDVLYKNGDWAATNSGQGSDFYLAVAYSNIVDDGNTGANTNSNYPHAVHTGKNEVKTLRFYNFATNNGTYSALPGCTFVVKSAHDDGATFTWTFTTPEDNPATPNVDERMTEIFLPENIPVGHYTIEEVSVPAGYVRDVESKRTFSVIQSEIFQNTMVFQDTIGIFLNHSVSGLHTGKSAEVEDYNNRTYEIMLNAYSIIDLYEMEPVDVLFVVDQSNSMLFPSGLKRAVNRNGQQVGTATLNIDGGSNNNYSMNALNLDTSKVYYLIADPYVTSTVFALWYRADTGTWWYQDASYYAKAKHNNTVGYQQPDGELAKFPSDRNAFEGATQNNQYKANGGPLDKTLGGKLKEHLTDMQSKGHTNRFQIYEAVDEYNRLHYLEQAVSEAIYQLAEANEQNTVTVIRFTKEVDESHCIGPLKLTPENAELLVESVNKIETSGGTRQDLALEHAYQHLTGTHKTGVGDLYTKDKAHTYTILITDGAPVTSSGATHSLGQYTDATPNRYQLDSASVYARIKGFAALVKEVEDADYDKEGNSTLITVGLGMDAVVGGSSVLSAIADQDMHANLEEAADLSEQLNSLLFSNLKVSGKTVRTADAVDIISDSFYPIAWVNSMRDVGSHRVLEMTEPVADSSKIWIVLEPNDWISNQGEYVGTGDDLGSQAGSNAKGHLIVNANGDFQLEWRNRPAEPWEGHFFVKAKEDFIGGNAIDTNKSAIIDLKQSTNSDQVVATLEMPIPTVNVRLLDMNQMNSEVTVFLGDLINEDGHSPLNSLEIFFNNTRFTKLISGEGTVLNNAERTDTTGLAAGTFDLTYAMGGLTAEHWQAMMEGAEVEIPYTYDDPSSHGPVGAFRFKLSKNGTTADYNTHEATQAGMGVEAYTLHVYYTAYELQEEGRPATNANNGAAGPGTEVGSAAAGNTLPTGFGNLHKENIHLVNVIPGSIEVTKIITDDLVSENGQTFLFHLHRQEDGDNTEHDIAIAVNVPANSNSGTAAVTNLKRGTYILTEAEDDAYQLKSITATGNCLITQNETSVTLVMGTDADGHNVIGKLEGATYTSYIRENSAADPQHGIYGHVTVTNEKTVYYGEIPVVKVWGNHAESHPDEAVYLVLYKDTTPVTENGQTRILRLDAANGWNGTFRVALDSKEQSVAALGYTVREATAVSTDETTGWTAGVLENDRDAEIPTIMYYENVAQEGEGINQGGVIYRVEYQRNDVTGMLTVTNYVAYILPNTGGVGTNMYTISGLSLVAVAVLMYGYRRRRKCERGAEA